MLTGYLYINFYNNTYTTAVCEVCACVRACVGLVAVHVVGIYSHSHLSCSVDVVSRNK